MTDRHRRLRVATYNLWNSELGWDRRLAAIVDELDALAADVIALQEAPCEARPGRSLAAHLEAETGYRHVFHLPYNDSDDDDDRPEGLALLTQLPARAIWTSWSDGTPTDNHWAMTAHLDLPGATLGVTLGVTNVHLDWQHPERRVAGIAGIVERLIDRHPADLEILCGDFNEHDDGPAAAYLEHPGPRRGAAGPRASPWRDAVTNSVGPAAAPITLDFAENPRWAGMAVSERPGRFDRIYLRDLRDPPALRVAASRLFGRAPANRFGIVPSDHYGVVVDLEI